MEKIDKTLGVINTQAVILHELYSSYLRAGFNEQMAFELVMCCQEAMLEDLYGKANRGK